MRAGVIEPVQIHIRQMIVLVVEAPGRTLRKAGPMVRILFPPAKSLLRENIAGKLDEGVAGHRRSPQRDRDPRPRAPETDDAGIARAQPDSDDPPPMPRPPFHRGWAVGHQQGPAR
jgi:hypothetical protein